jgi:hypothetical protein
MQTHDQEGLHLVTAIFEYVPLARVSQYLQPVARILANRMQAHKTPKVISSHSLHFSHS